MQAPPSLLWRSLLRPPTTHVARAREHIPVPRRWLHAPRPSTLHRPSPVLSQLPSLRSPIRCESTGAKPAAAPSSNGSTTAPESRLERDQVPAYELTFTCKVCSTRSSHRLSKQGYHHGTVLISCPGCKNRHLISDHLKIFSDKSVTLEDLMQQKGNLVRRGSLSLDGDVEFWDDGSTSPRSANFVPADCNSGSAKDRLTEQPAPQGSTETDSGQATPKT